MTEDTIALRTPDEKYTSQYKYQSFGEGNASKKKCWKTLCGKRHLIALLAMLGIGNVYAMRVNLSVALVAMVTNHTIYRNGQWMETRPEFSWSPQLQGIVLSSFFYGYIFTQIPGGILAVKFGGRNLFGIGVFLTSFLTLLIPIATRWSIVALIILRILIGNCQGVVYPANHALWSKWAPPLERSKLVTISGSGAHLGTVVSMLLSAVLAQATGWPSIFYVFGSVGVVWTCFWFLIARNSPSEDGNISIEEREFIQESLKESGASTKAVVSVPWKSIFTSMPIWAIIVAQCCNTWGFFTLLTEMPSFLKKRLDFDLGKVGFLSALPYLILAIVAQIGGQVADFLRRKKIFSTVVVRKLFNSMGVISQAVCFVIVGYATNKIVVVVSLILAVGFDGLTLSGFFVNHLDVAPQYAAILMAISNTVSTLPGIISPLITGAIVDGNTATEWRIVFFLSVSIYAAGCIFYIVFASGEIQKWATDNGYEETSMKSDGEEHQ